MKGTRKAYSLTVEYVFYMAARLEGERLRREKLAARRAAKGGKNG
jgi:hypothetical protein